MCFYGAVFLFKPFHVFEIRGGEKNTWKHASLEDSVAVLNRFRDAAAGRAVVSAAILSQRQLSVDLLKIYLR